MKIEYGTLTELEAKVWAAALDMLYIQRQAFTIQAFCQENGFKLNRHTRAALNQVVASKRARRQRAKDTDGRYHTFYVQDERVCMKVLL